MRKKLITLIVFFTLLTGIAAYAANLEYTTTLLYFNVNENRDVQVLSLGGAWVSATSAGAPTTGNIEFNTSNPYAYWVNATIEGGGGSQDDTTPILQVQNIGTIDAQINISINETMPSCMLLRYENDTITYPPSTSDLGTTNVTLVGALGSGETALDIWLFANFTNCGTGDTTQRNFTVYADYAS